MDDLISKEDIINKMRERALSYTPEWRFDDQNLDIGSALALVYADMLLSTYHKYNQLLYKNQIAFFNILDAKLLPAVPAKGYVSFNVSNKEIEGEQIPQGFIVNANSEETETGKIEYEVSDDIFVIPAQMTQIYQTATQKDTIYQIADSKEGIKDAYLFTDKGRNIQEHCLFFCHSYIFDIHRAAEIGISLKNKGEYLSDSYLSQLTNPTIALFEYWTDKGYQSFENVYYREGKIYLVKGDQQVPFSKTSLFDNENYWIRCTIHYFSPFKEMHFNEVTLTAKSDYIAPDSIFGNNIECKQEGYYPFGESIGLYDEAYFASSEVLSKKGAWIEFSFNLDFVKVPLAFNQENEKIDWDWTMKKENYKPNYEFDLTIEEVIWEYYNGKGWARLFQTNEGHDVFSTHKGMIGQFRKLTFICPEDIEPVLIGAVESYYIRARILRVNNVYKLKGHYICPVLDNTSFIYDYQGSPYSILPEKIVTTNNMQTQFYTGGRQVIYPFFTTDQIHKTVYFAFDLPPKGAPLKLLFILEPYKNEKKANLKWQYYNGKKWQELIVVDETENFSRTGIVTLVGPSDIVHHNLFNQDKYWIRVIDCNDVFDKGSNYPHIIDIIMNAVHVKNRDRELTEYFSMDIYQANKKFDLQYGKVIQSKVYINELKLLSKNEIESLKDSQQVEVIYDDAGLMQEVWVEWKYVENFLFAQSQDRVYSIEPNQGALLFGNGKNGRVPPVSEDEDIKVIYQSGGGDLTNIESHQISDMEMSIGFVHQVDNPLPFVDGADQETIKAALKRNASNIRTQNKALTIRDFEAIALSVSRSIERVKCFSGIDDRGEIMKGAITLVVVSQSFNQRYNHFDKIKDQILEVLKSKIDNNLWVYDKLFIIEPHFIKIDVFVEISVKSFNGIFNIKNAVLEKLSNFINANRGNLNKEGWQIGSLPNVIQISNMIKKVSGVEEINTLYIKKYKRKGIQWQEIEELDDPFVLPSSGNHEVAVTVD